MSSRASTGLVVALCMLGPPILSYFGGWPGGRPFVAELGSSLGIAALSVLGLLMLLPSRLRALEGLGADVAVRLHRRLASGFVALLAAHVVVVAVVAVPARIALFTFFGQPWRAQAAIASTGAIAVLIATSVFRRRLRLSYAVWRVMHSSLAVAGLTLAVAHTVGWHRYLIHGVGPLALAGVGLGPVVAVVRLRTGRHRGLHRAPFVVESVTPERGGAATLRLRADGHSGVPYGPGQFAWIKLADQPFGVHEHPFSYSSSAERRGRPSFTIRAYGGFSAAAATLAPGTHVLVDGPHGAFTLRPTAPGIVLVAAGIGITPIMSILQTAVDRGDRRRHIVIYGSRDEEGITFREQLDALQGLLDLQFHHVLSRPSPTWRGQRGRIDATVLDRILPARLRGWQFFLCGSGPAVDTALRALTELGIPPERIHAERFIEV